MGRPTIAAQIAKAAAEGDMEKVKGLAAKLEAQPKPKVKTKSKPKVKAKPDTEDEVELYEAADIVDSGFTAPAKGNKRPVYTDENGDERVRSRIVPFKIVKNRKNSFVDDIEQESSDIEFDKKTHKHTPSKRQYREPSKKIKVKCTRCKDVKVLWAGEVMNSNWVCDDCLRSNHR